MNSYELSRLWFDFAFDNPSKITPAHGILYFFCIENCNRLGWKKEFGLPTTMAKEAIGIRSYNTYINTLNDLVDWGFFKLIERSKNQYSSNIIALIKFDEALDEALDKALTKHASKQRQYNKTIEQQTIEPIKQISDDFEIFWDKYHSITKKSKSDKEPAKKHWLKLNATEKVKAFEKIKDYFDSLNDKKYCKKARTYLADKNFNDEFIKHGSMTMSDKQNKGYAPVSNYDDFDPNKEKF